jgi:hydrogenase maturation protease
MSPRRSPIADPELLVIGIGNPIRGDDAVGLHLVRRLDQYFDHRLNHRQMMAPDMACAAEVSRYRRLLVIDALAAENKAPYRLIHLVPDRHQPPAAGWMSHVFDWQGILTLALALYDRSPRADLMGVAASEFDISEQLSEVCHHNADLAFRYLVPYCSQNR